MNVKQKYNKTIKYKPISEKDNNDKIDLCFLTYNGKVTRIIDYFNKLKIEECKSIVKNSITDEKDHKRNCLQICSFLNFSNIFLYLLSYDADPNHWDSNQQSTWHMIFYRGHVKLLSLLLNDIRYKLKMESLANIDKIKLSYGFSNLDIVKGKLSRAVHLTDVNIRKFAEFQKQLREEAQSWIEKFIDKIFTALCQRDKQGQTPLHLGAMSKFPLAYLACFTIWDFDFFKFDETWDDYLSWFEGWQSWEIKVERRTDPRRTGRLERELLTLLGDDFIKKELSKYYNKKKNEKMEIWINMQDENEDSVLHISAFHGDYRIVNKFVSYGGNKMLKNRDDKLPVDLAKDNFVRKVLTNLNEAAKDSDIKNITELVNFGENINEKRSIALQAPLHKIIENKEKDNDNEYQEKENKHEVLEKMLDMGADPNWKDSNGWSALHYACQYGDMKSVKILIDHKANIDSYSNNERIPLHMAANMNHPEIVKYLLDNGSNPNCKDHLGCTPMHLASKQGNTKCLKILLDTNADLYSLDFRGWNILHYAAFHGHCKTVQFICKRDADHDILRNQRNKQNKLPIEIVRDPNIKPFFTSIWHAAKDGDLDTIINILHNKQEINETTTFATNTALHFAVLNNHYLLVKLLIEKGCKIDVENKDGATPKTYAAEMGKLIIDKYQKYLDESKCLNKKQGIKPGKFSSSTKAPFGKINTELKNISPEEMDLREIMRDKVFKIPQKDLNAIISKKNYRIPIWNVYDFSVKICKIFDIDLNKENETNAQNSGQIQEPGTGTEIGQGQGQGPVQQPETGTVQIQEPETGTGTGQVQEIKPETTIPEDNKEEVKSIINNVGDNPNEHPIPQGENEIINPVN